MATILDGRETSSTIMEELQVKVDELKAKGVTPSLALVLTGIDKYSRRYVRTKVKRAESIGIEARLHHLEETTTNEVVELVEKLCSNPEIHGVLVQLPVAEGLDEGAIVEAVTAEKDVDGILRFS
jgi:methylenetetrahydrofolate dehydrogenase (NADP+)/methenyltetrahydrofolate cyclohydrolase